MDIAGQLEGNLRHFVSQGTPAPTPAAPPAPQANQNGFAADEYVRGADLNRLAPELVDQRVDSRMVGINEQLANIALDTVRREFTDEFSKYGPEIYGKLSTLNKQTGVWTVDNLRTVVNIVRAGHVDEIVRDKLRGQSPMEPALRSTGAAPVPANASTTQDFSLNSEKLPVEFREKLKAAGVNDSNFEDFLKGSGMTREQYFKLFEKRQVITEAPRI